jgi:carboxyl-terminal processing protease
MNKVETKNSKTIWIIILTVCMLCIGFVSGRIFQSNGGSQLLYNIQKSINPKEINADMLWYVWDIMENQYVDSEKISKEDMLYGAIKGMVSSFEDPATIFLDPEETKEFNSASEGKLFEGIGAELGYENGTVIIVSPIEGSPAKEAGIKAGDYILAIDGVELLPTDTVYDAVNKIRGEAGTDVVLTVLHKASKETEDIKITRREITVPSMEVTFLGSKKDIAYLDLDRFTDSSYLTWTRVWDESVKEIKDSGVKKMILDLRGNPGGYFDAAVYAADDFLDSGFIISQQQDGNGAVKEYKSIKGGQLVNIELIVLVDQGSASASEILAGALQQANRAEVLGQKTYGKGTAQSVIDLNDGSSLHITILKWLLPDGSWLNRENSITPDMEVEFTDEEFVKGDDPQLDKAIEEINK